MNIFFSSVSSTAHLPTSTVTLWSNYSLTISTHRERWWWWWWWWWWWNCLFSVRWKTRNLV